MFTPVRQRLVRTHPVSRRRSLYLSSHIGSIVGWPVPEARAFLRDLTEHATQPRFVYAHRWQPYDLVMWDNRQTMHRVRRFPAEVVRDMRRTTVAGDGPTYVAGARPRRVGQRPPIAQRRASTPLSGGVCGVSPLAALHDLPEQPGSQGR